ncbi:MAG: beta strand repeat-containing protein, partial [Dehalococcoidia bacterium]
STTGTALNVNASTIGASGLTFQSISVNGGTNGILLNTTGSFGGLTVTGTGTTAGSGGTIQNTTSRGASFISATNISLANMVFTNAGTTDLDANNAGLSTGDNLATNAAIHLQTVTTTTLTNLQISGGAEQGINGNTVSNFTLSNSSITNAGNEPDEDGIHFFNMSGTSAITNTTITSTVPTPNTTGGDDHLNLQMQSGTLNLTISGGSATNANKGSGYLFGIRGTTDATITFSSANASNNFSGGIVADAFDNAKMRLSVTNSTSSGSNDQLSVSAGDNSQVSLDASGNTLTSASTSDFVVLFLLGSAFDNGFVFNARITNNTITTGNQITADAIFVFNAGGGQMNVAITNNTVNYQGTQRPITVNAGQDGAGAINATITGNTIDIRTDGTNDAFGGIIAQAAISSPTGDGASVCADIGGAGALRNTFTRSLGGAAFAAGDIRVRQRLNGTMRLPGYAGAATDTAAVQAYLNGRNTVLSPSTATVNVTGFAGGGACTQPTIPIP